MHDVILLSSFSDNVPTCVFQRLCDAFSLLFLLFISEVIACHFSFSFLDYVQIKVKKIIFSMLQLVRNSPVRFIPDRKQFNLAIGGGCCRVEPLLQVSAIQSLRLLLLGVKHQKPYYTQAKEAFFAKCCVLPQKHANLDWQEISCSSKVFDFVK